ncbi:sensor histidine kinase KdpD [Parasegetibacter sp. NRK P23]|uniref:sensor histidine kinase n=1 Tax=Parasegetibacter sp. NRK P23 TaxID=2942999 RepID=UPI002043FA72|nr:HAMP domain-containing sensor histidine kinase [Parasegetibacter sp. NRK P23]MCM5528158.1 HAMP domain-containing histidine kinase [Parasegetibacter sp. NRK P23]
MRASSLRYILLVTGSLVLVALVCQVFWLGKLYLFISNAEKVPEGYPGEQVSFSIWSAALVLLALVAIAACFYCFSRRRSMDVLQKDFVNNITHEFKTPLAVMKIASDVLTDEQILKQPEKLKKYGSIIQQQTDHLQGQVDKLLKISLTDQRLMAPEKKQVVVRSIFEHAVSLLEPLIHKKNADIRFSIDPACSIVEADEQQLQMVVIDLLENALKYSAHPQIILSTFRKKNMSAISCRDNGPGLDKAHQERVFQKFYRVPTGNIHNVKGFGLGLYFVKKIVDRHKGKIELRSEDGKGSEFIVYLPQ